MSQERLWALSNLESVHLSPTNHCNFECLMCPTPRMTNKKGFLSWGTFERTISELRRLRKQGGKFCELHFYLEGEPFLNQNFREMLKRIDQSFENIEVIVSTNGYFLSPQVVDEIFELKRNQYIYLISVDASNSELYKTIKPGNHFEIVEKNLKYFLIRKKIERTGNPYLVLQFIVMSINENDRHDFYWKWEPFLGPRIKASYCLYDESYFEDNLSHIYWKRYYARSHPLCEEDPLFSRTYGLGFPCSERARVCVWLWKKLVVGWDGDIKVCCFYPESSGLIGNINEQPLKQLFEGGNMKRFREHFLDRKIESVPVCHRCPPIAWAFDKRLEEHLGLC